MFDRKHSTSATIHGKRNTAGRTYGQRREARTHSADSRCKEKPVRTALRKSCERCRPSRASWAEEAIFLFTPTTSAHPTNCARTQLTTTFGNSRQVPHKRILDHVKKSPP